jgi:hypothetical protein
MRMSSTPRPMQLIHDREPEFGALVVGDPEAKHLAQAVAGDAQGDVDGVRQLPLGVASGAPLVRAPLATAFQWLTLHQPAVGVADLHARRVEDDDRIHPLDRAGLPFPDLVEHGLVRRENDSPDRFPFRLTPADQVRRDLQPVDLLKMCLDIPHAEAMGVEADDLVIDAVDAGLALPDQLGLEAAVAIAGHGERQFAVLALRPLGPRAIAPVGLARRGLALRLMAKMRRDPAPRSGRGYAAMRAISAGERWPRAEWRRRES